MKPTKEILIALNHVLERKKQGIDCTEEESGEIKGWLRENTTLPKSCIGIFPKEPSDQETLEDIQLLFPIEYGEFLDELEDDLTRKGDRESYWQILNTNLEELNLGKIICYAKDRY